MRRNVAKLWIVGSAPILAAVETSRGCERATGLTQVRMSLFEESGGGRIKLEGT
jgi:hypothetical protein